MFFIKTVNRHVASCFVHKDINMLATVHAEKYDHSVCSTICARECTECINSSLAVPSEGAFAARRCDNAWTDAANEASPVSNAGFTANDSARTTTADGRFLPVGTSRRRDNSPRLIRLSAAVGRTVPGLMAAHVKREASSTKWASCFLTDDRALTKGAIIPRYYVLWNDSDNKDATATNGTIGGEIDNSRRQRMIARNQ